jgi:DEAD/DEAH box helicase domain-containing protein
VLRNLVQLLEARPVLLSDLAESLAQSSKTLRNKDKPELATRVVVSLLSLISEARTWLPEREDARVQREDRDEARRTRPLLEVRLQLWQRELRRMVADLGDVANDKLPTLRYSDDLTDDQRSRHLPVIHCRDCGAMGWGSLVARDRSDVFSVGLNRFYQAFFSDDPQVRFLWPGKAVEEEDSKAFGCALIRIRSRGTEKRALRMPSRSFKATTCARYLDEWSCIRTAHSAEREPTSRWSDSAPRP